MMYCTPLPFRPIMAIRVFVQEKPFNDLQKARYIIDAVCTYTKTKEADLKGGSRLREICEPRHMAIKLIRERCKTLSLKFIGCFMGDRDHSTIISSISAADNLIITDANFKKAYEALSLQVRQIESKRI